MLPINPIARFSFLLLLGTPMLNGVNSPLAIARPPATRITQLTATEFFERGIARYERGDAAGALADFTEALRLQPNYAVAYYNRGVVRFKAQENVRDAIADFSEAIRLNPQYVDAYYNRAVARVKLGQYWPAIDDTTEVIRLDPFHDRAYYLRGLIYSENLGDYQTGIDDFSEAIRLNPNLAAPYFKRGNARFRTGDREGAIEDYNEAIYLDPDDPEAYYNRGVSRYQIGDREGARADLQQSADLSARFGNLQQYRQAMDTLKQLIIDN